MQKLIILIFIVYSSAIFAQYDHLSVFSDLTGNDLYDKVVEAYKPNSVLSFGNTRDTMFGVIYVEQDSVSGVYSQYTRYLDPNADPTIFLYVDGGELALNTEHTYPQSKGAELEPGKSDLHHLFPTKASVNSARGSLPFDEVNDNQTESWFNENIKTSNIPNTNIDAYSELGEGKFEPREDFKGNVSRAMFYFFTMYRSAAMNSDPNYFESQKEVLCDWHYLDPVDQKEWERSFLIANYQDGKANPFVLDCTLAARLYCGEIDPGCKSTDVEDLPLEEQKIKVIPNPNSGLFKLVFNSNYTGEGFLQLYDWSQKLVFSQKVDINSGINDIEINNKLPTGVYLSKITLPAVNGTKFLMNKIIIE